MELSNPRRSPRLWKSVQLALLAGLVALAVWGAISLGKMLMTVPIVTWVMVLRNTFWTLLRVIIVIALSSLWAVPVGIWIGTSQKRTRLAQPIVQVLASYPAPMLYPLALGVLLALGINFQWGSMFLMMLGVQWYVLFNVIAGALRVPQELRYACDLMETPRWERWTTLYLPSVFPALVTGWVTAAGGAWNASIVAEYIAYKGSVLKATGLGATIVAATDTADFPLLAASLTVMVLVVIGINRSVWSRIYAVAQTRFRLDV
jgi:NitT/TauT family transport system permease protein